MNHHERCQHKAYRLSCADFDELWEHAGGCCEICRTPENATPGKMLAVDHASEYGYFAVRGLLCSSCNFLMRSVDRGEKHDHRARAYRNNAWFVRVLHARHEANKAATRQQAAIK